MPRGTLLVLLVSAKALEDTDFLNGMDPYAALTIRSQVKKSTVASGLCSVPLEALFAEGTIPVTAYSVVKDQEYKGELKPFLNFSPGENGIRGYEQEVGYGGWKQSTIVD